jgi:3-deoxy-manno-octulosonate cytidylyltransferase (CMP-KDO synthetase)
MIIRVAELTAKALGKENTYIATDDTRIADVVQLHGYQAVMTPDDCLTGTDRLWEFAKKIEADVYVNVQGDEPMLDPNDIINIARMKAENPDFVINGMCSLSEDEDPHSVNIPKVLVNKNNELMYMSRLAIPGIKDSKTGKPDYKKQVCIYGFSYQDLEAFGSQKRKAEYEKYEDIEILRFFDLGIPVKMVETSGASLAVDVPEDVSKVEEALKNL